MKYFDGKDFHETQNELNTRYEITDEYQIQIFDELNSRTNEDDIFHYLTFVPDNNGKPIVARIRREHNDILQILRRLRSNKVFPIINRSNFWYDSLTQQQKDELQVWYKKWLDVTDTLEVPNKPTWLE